MMKNLVLFACLVSFSLPAWSLDETDRSSSDYLTIDSVTVTDITDEIDSKDLSLLYPVPQDKTLGEIIAVLDGLIAVGDRIMILVEKGRPILNTDFQRIRVLPQVETGTLADTLSQMHSWSEPTSKSMRIEFKNRFGMKVVVFEFSVHFQYGGQYKGKGRYLSGIKVTPNNVNVKWGFQLDAKSVLVEVTNVGDSSEDPIAGATMEISYSITTALNEQLGAVTCFMAGDGRYKEVNY